MVDDKHTNKRRIIQRPQPNTPPVYTEPVRHQNLQTPADYLIVERHDAGQTLRQICSDLGMTLVQVLRHLEEKHS